jgi:hypothetical protein
MLRRYSVDLAATIIIVIIYARVITIIHVSNVALRPLAFNNLTCTGIRRKIFSVADDAEIFVQISARK